MKKFLFLFLFIHCTNLNGFNKEDMNSLLERQDWKVLIPKVRNAFEQKDETTLKWVKKVGALPYVPLMYESMRNTVKRALTENELQKLLCITIISLITTTIDLLSCEKLQYITPEKQEYTYKLIKENFRHRLYYKVPTLQRYWEANTPYKDFKFQYSYIIQKAKKSYDTLTEKKTSLPSPIWVTNVTNTSFLNLRYWIDFETPSLAMYNSSKEQKSLEIINKTRAENLNILWDFFLTRKDWKDFFAISWQDIITDLNSKNNNTLWLSLLVAKDSSNVNVN